MSILDINKAFKGSWILSVKCNFKIEPRIWKFHYDKNDKDEWTANPEKLYGKGSATLDTKLSERSKQLNDAFTCLRSQLELTSSDGIQNWLVGEDKPDLRFIDKDSTIIFNHIVASQRTSPLEMIVSVVGRHRMTEIRGLLEGQACWFYTQTVGFVPRNANDIESEGFAWIDMCEHYALAYPTLFFIYKDNKIKCRDEIKTYVGQYLSAHRQHTKITILKYHVEEHTCTLQLRFDNTLCHYHRGRLCKTIPIPGKPKLEKNKESVNPKRVASPEIVISSPLVRKCLSSLSDIWQDRAEAILVSGPPGSGKENYALSIPYGSGKNVDVRKGVSTISLANGTIEEQERQLFGFQQDDGSIVDGLLAKSKGSALFIDESHYPENIPGVRASLLRALEAKEYYPVGSLNLRYVEDVQWIFASSLRLDRSEKSLSRVPPADFWTRMTHVVQIDHPLDHRAYLKYGIRGYEAISEKQKQVIIDLFKCFWWDRVKAHFRIDPVLVLSDNKRMADLREKDASEQITRGYAEALLKEEPLNKIARMFADALIYSIGAQSLSDVSIRGLRSMVSRIFSRCVADVTAGMWLKEFGMLFLKPEVPTSEEDQKKLESEQLPSVRERIYGVIQEIQQIARLKS